MQDKKRENHYNNYYITKTTCKKIIIYEIADVK